MNMADDGRTTGRQLVGWSSEQCFQVFKEIVIGILALALIGITLLITQQTFGLISESEEIPGAKDMLVLMLGPAGL